MVYYSEKGFKVSKGFTEDGRKRVVFFTTA
jgi:hypothetical protein